MIFSEVYGNYFNAVAKILGQAVEEPISKKRINEIVEESAFSESILTIPDAIQSGKWPFLDEEGMAYLQKKPSMPLSWIQKRWLKSLLSDKRIQLFEPDIRGLEAVEPLFDADTFVYYDQYLDGDPYEDKEYINHFKIIHRAIGTGHKIKIWYPSRKGGVHLRLVDPYKLEYSAKDDKFRLLGRVQDKDRAKDKDLMFNLNKIQKVELTEIPRAGEYCRPSYKLREVELRLLDERNALERAMLHFSHFEKMTERIEENQYRFVIKYDVADETELIIRVLSFGPMLKVVGPEPFKAQIKTRLIKQKSCGL